MNQNHDDTMDISIHALRTEGDARLGRFPHIRGYFYPRPPYGGRRLAFWIIDHLDREFLSTPSVRRATMG